MKYFLALFFICAVVACKQKEKQLSDSYKQIRDYLADAGINRPDMIYFYSGKPRMPLPNVYCFNKDGRPLATPPQCFGNIEAYIKLLNDSIIPYKTNVQGMAGFLDSVPVIDAYDSLVRLNNLPTAEYYLFIDFLAIPEKIFKEILKSAETATLSSKKKIKLFLVHAISYKNARSLPVQSKDAADSAKREKME